MTNELGTTLQEIEDKADRKREALRCLIGIENTLPPFPVNGLTEKRLKKIRQIVVDCNADCAIVILSAADIGLAQKSRKALK